MMRVQTSSVIKSIGDYQLTKTIGRGSFANVYLAQKDGKQYAVKEMDISQAAIQDGRLELFTREIEILQQLQHPNIVKLFDTKEVQDNLYLVFEYCGQGDLEKYLKKSNLQKIPEHQARIMFVQIVSALVELKRLKIVHRDLKLANILLTEQMTVKLADFGFAKLMPQDQLLESYCGTPLTMAPEILKNDVNYTEKCDMWSLGVILYQIVIGVPPFKPNAGLGIEDLLRVICSTKLQFPLTKSHAISPELKSLLQKLLSVNPLERFSIEEVIEHEWVKQEFNFLVDQRQQPSKQKNQIIIQQESLPIPITKDIKTNYVPIPITKDIKTNSTNILAHEIKIQLLELQKFTVKIQNSLMVHNLGGNQICQQIIQNLLQNRFYISLNVNQKTNLIFPHKNSLDSMLLGLCLELYAQLIYSPRKQDCLKIIKEIFAYYNDSNGLRTSFIILNDKIYDEISYKSLEQLISDTKLPDTTEKCQFEQMQKNKGDWQLIQQLTLERESLELSQQN